MSYTLHTGDALTVLRSLPDASVHTCVTSPPYWRMRDYQVDGRRGMGIELNPEVTAALARLEDVRGAGVEGPAYYFAPGPGNHQTRAGNWRRRLRWLFKQAKIAQTRGLRDSFFGWRDAAAHPCYTERN